MPDRKKARKKKVDKSSREQVFHSRKYRRIPFHMEVEYTTGRKFEKGVSENISQGGIFISSDEPLPGGKTTTIKFVVAPEREPVEIKGRVAWVMEGEQESKPGVPTGMGVEFIYKDESEKNIVSGFVRDLFDLWRVMAIAGKRKNDH